MATIQCVPRKKIFPHDVEDEIDFCVVSYEAISGDFCNGMEPHMLFNATGRLLPTPRDCVCTLEGEWKSGKDGPEFSVKFAKINTPRSFMDVRNILASMPYLGDAIANKLVNEYNASALQELDSNPELLERFVKSRKKSAVDGYRLRRLHRDTFIFLCEHSVPSDRASSIALSIPSLATLRRDPYGYSVGTQLTFKVAEKIAKEEGVPSATLSGAMAAIVDVVQQAEGSSSGDAFQDGEPAGNTYVEKDSLMGKASSQVGLLKQDELMTQAFDQLVTEGILISAENRYVYRAATADAEYGIAAELTRLNSVRMPAEEFRYDIAEVELQQKMRLAPEQRSAVKTALNNPLTLLIGGPGTGKTTIERVIIQLFRKFHPDKKILLVAPTARAACRMSESTGEPASTVHKALGVTAGEEVLMSNVTLDAGLIMIDEASMLGSQESWALFKAIKTGTQVVVVGDTNQLPSVGAGNVLAEMIRSKCFAIAQLITVYRQKAGSTIAVNCARIKLGKTELEYTDTFEMRCVTSQSEALAEVLNCIRSEMNQGLTLDDICVLSPYRKSTKTGTNQVNEAIQSEFGEKEMAISYGKRRFYIHDKVMFKKNCEDAVNGDVGTIVEITGNKFSVDYGDGRTVKYSKSDLRNFDLAYAITIHKSQGAEYPTCIIVCMDEHEMMLKRNLIYTAISRAKAKVIIVGTQAALRRSIVTEDASVRNSRLAELLRKNSGAAA